MNTEGCNTKSRIDRLGAFASIACAIHCLIAPFVFLLLPSFGPIWTDPAAHIVLAFLVVPLALASVTYGYRQHRLLRIPITAGLGLILIMGGMVAPATASVPPAKTTTVEAKVAADKTAQNPECAADCCAKIKVEDDKIQFSIPTNTIVTIIGSIFLALSHLWNLRLCAKPKCCAS